MVKLEGVVLRIVNREAQPDAFRRQVDLVRSTGAVYNDTEQVWRLQLTTDRLRADVLDPLFEAARVYGTSVAVES